MKYQNSKFRVWIAPHCFFYHFREISMENWQTKRHLEIFGSMFTKLQIHFIIKAIGHCIYASFCIIIDGPHCIHQIISCCLNFYYWLQVFSNQYRRSYILSQNSTCFLPKLVTTFLNTQIKRGIETSIYVFIFCWFIRRCSRYFPSIRNDIFNVSCYLQVLKSKGYIFI